jgi:hypothetical protein
MPWCGQKKGVGQKAIRNENDPRGVNLGPLGYAELMGP